MAFRKTAFAAPEHLKIARKIIGYRFDEHVFQQIQQWTLQANAYLNRRLAVRFPAVSFPNPVYF